MLDEDANHLTYKFFSTKHQIFCHDEVDNLMWANTLSFWGCTPNVDWCCYWQRGCAYIECTCIAV